MKTAKYSSSLRIIIDVIIENIYKFCKENPPLERNGFYDLISGKALEYQGWRLPCGENEFKEKKELRLGKHIEIKNIKNNEILKIKNISKFCRDNNINFSGKYNGW